jgi:trimeric autotransporter adhesin
LSVTGCGHKSAPVVFCNAGDSGPAVGQAFNVVLSSSLATTGESLNYGQIGIPLSASATDCKGNAVAVKSFTYSSTSSFSVNATGGAIFADINPMNGTVCGGQWNRNTGGGIQDFTTCTPPSSTPVSTSAISLSAPTTPTAAAGSATTLVLGQATDTVSGSLSLALGTGAPVSFALAPNTSLAQLAGQINSAAAQPSSAIAGTTAAVTTASTQFLTITGPAGVSNNLVTTGTALVDSTSFFLATITAEADGVTSNGIAVYVHPIATGVVLGGSTPGVMNGSCPAGTIDPGTDCCPNDTVGTPIVAPVYTGTPSGSFPLGCASQNQVGQLVARVYANGTTTPANNITCQVGHLTFGAQTAGIVSIDENGAATAQQPGSTTITATIANSSSATNAGYFSTCPPASIALADPSSSSNSINVAVNTLQPLTATVLDTQGNPITGLSLEFNSTTPQTIPPAIGSVTPLFPGSADITAVCQPATCNPSPFAQIGLYGNGKAITSNPITITSPGTSSTVVYMGSTSSDYVAFKDFTTNQTSALIKLPYVPNSMVMNQSGTDIYLGSAQGLMSIALASNTVSAANQSVPGVVLGVSPDGSTIVITDPTRQTISLVSVASNAVTTSYGGVGTSATWSPDTQAVYITTATLSSTANPTSLTASPTITPSATVTPSPVILTHSPYTDWQTATADQPYTDAIVAVPSIGAFFAGSNTTDGRSYCPSSTITTTGNPSVVANQFLPLAGQAAVPTDQIAATTNGSHILGAHAVTGGSSTLTDIDLVLPTNTGTGTGNDVGAACPMTIPTDYFQTSLTTQPLAGVNAGIITGVFASSNSAAAFVTYTPPAANPVTNAILPLYVPPATGQGTLQYLTLSNGATQNAAPESGVFSTDNFTFYVGTGSSDGTSADNDVHLITLTYPTSGAPTATEAPGSTITPQLPLASGSGYAPVNLIAQHPKKTTS